MTSRRWFKRRLSHTCTIQRDSGTARSATGRVINAYSDIATAVPCFYTSRKENRVSEGKGNVVVKVQTILFGHDQDVIIDDKITSIADSGGTSIEAGPFTVNDISKPVGIGGDVAFLECDVDRPTES